MVFPTTKYYIAFINATALLTSFCWYATFIATLHTNNGIKKTGRVQLKTDSINFWSRKAIEKIGGEFERILRNDRIKENGVSRSAAYYSILDDEWEESKQKIITQMTDKRKAYR